MNITRALLVLVIKALQDKAGESGNETEDRDVFFDAADALADALDLLVDEGEI